MIQPVSIIILAWNRWALTQRLLDSLEGFAGHPSVHVTVVDNGCRDETAGELTRYPWIRVIRNETNLGFVRGVNGALREIDPDDDVVLLNNDIEILHADWLERLQATAYGSASVGIVGCRLVLEDGRLLHAGTWIRPDDYWGEQIGSLETDLDQYTEDRPVEGIVFACAYIKRQTLREV
ncbi:MAG TPA: glycosyltransferase, partial [Gemmatimonadaceae bacterium]|nr:glycosyltransferase [Gemmatimonadaceae bacterium]